jgi:hypothetical protein
MDARAARVRAPRFDDLAAATRRNYLDHPPQEIGGAVDKGHDAPGIAAVLVDEKSMPTNSQAVEAPHRSQQENWVRFENKSSAAAAPDFPTLTDEGDLNSP